MIIINKNRPIRFKIKGLIIIILSEPRNDYNHTSGCATRLGRVHELGFYVLNSCFRACHADTPNLKKACFVLEKKNAWSQTNSYGRFGWDELVRTWAGGS